MKHLIHELHRRSLWQVLGIYLGVAWLVLQIVDVIIDNFGLPEWVAPFALVLLLIGLPIVLATAFVNEGVGSHDGHAVEARPVSGPAHGPAVPQRETGSDTAPGPPGTSAPAGSVRRHWLTWRRALAGGVAAFALLGVLTGLYLATRSLGIGPAGTLVAKGVLEGRSPVLVADFDGADEELAHTATEALRIDLGQSQVVTVVEPTEIAGVLRRMERPADADLDLALAREVAQREGIPVLISGDVDRAGAGYVFAARLIDAESGDVLVSAREAASDDSEVLDALDRLSRTLRERIGESLRDLAREAPLEAVTTASLPALERYSAAIRASELEGDEDRSVALLEEAVALDSTFAMAWRKLGTILNNRFVDRARAVEALERAYRHRDRLGPRERYQVEGIYLYQMGTDPAASIQAYRNLLDLDPDDRWALNNLGVVHGYLRDHERARELYGRAVELDSAAATSWLNVIQETFATGDTAGARELATRFAERSPDNPFTLVARAVFAGATRQYDQAETLSRTLIERHGSGPFLAQRGTELLAASLAVRGRVTEAREVLERRMEATERAGDRENFLNTAGVLAEIELATLGEEPALGRLSEALDRVPMEDVHPLNRPYAGLAITYAGAGRASRAAALLDSMDALIEPRLRSHQQAEMFDAARAYQAAAEGRPADALDWARRADRGFCTACGAQAIADVQYAAGATDGAIAGYERYVESDWFWRLVALDQYYLGRNLERLGELHEQKGDLRTAARYYAEFTDLWENADPALQPRVESARARIEAILRETG